MFLGKINSTYHIQLINNKPEIKAEKLPHYQIRFSYRTH